MNIQYTLPFSVMEREQNSSSNQNINRIKKMMYEDELNI